MLLVLTVRALTYVWAGAIGLLVGSFLNVCIHRLPIEGQSVWNPRRSHCPACRHAITWKENLPVLSWVLQRGRCTACGWRIPIRYPLVEILTAVLWCVVVWRTPEGAWGLLAVHLLVITGLIVATFVDFDCFEIPDEVSIGGMVLAPLCSLLVPRLHEATWIAREMTEGWTPGAPVDRAGALAGCLAGMAVGGGVLWLIGKAGKLLYGRDAMGFGDVKLLAAGGGFVGPGGVLLALMVGSLLASVVGVANIVRYVCLTRRRARVRRRRQPFGKAVAIARIAGRYVPFGPYLGMGIGIALLAWKDGARLFD